MRHRQFCRTALPRFVRRRATSGVTGARTPGLIVGPSSPAAGRRFGASAPLGRRLLSAPASLGEDRHLLTGTARCARVGRLVALRQNCLTFQSARARSPIRLRSGVLASRGTRCEVTVAVRCWPRSHPRRLLSHSSPRSGLGKLEPLLRSPAAASRSPPGCRSSACSRSLAAAASVPPGLLSGSLVLIGTCGFQDRFQTEQTGRVASNQNRRKGPVFQGLL